MLNILIVHNSTPYSYRKDIDGLRAIAILPIIFYHYGWTTLFGGGFVGVDIFFVISGFLITRIIYNKLKLNTFSFIDFYSRRVRRIVPALAFMLTFCLIMAILFYFSDTFKNFLKSFLSTLLMGSNFYFWKDGGYFAAPSHTKPLLHTWSLSIEEQFYFVFPVFLFLIYKYKKHTYNILFGFLTLSFLFATVVTFWKPNSAFFLPITRAWELLLGSILAIHLTDSNIKEKEINRNKLKLYGYLGLGLILTSIFFYGYIDQLAFPGFSALLPCVGTMLCILSGSGQNVSPVQKILSWQPFVCIGLISYSLYLWHWPIYVFYKLYFNIIKLTNFEVLLLCFITTFLSVISYKFIEQPIRHKRILSSSKSLWIFLLLYFCILSGVAGFFYFYGNTFLHKDRVVFLESSKNGYVIAESAVQNIPNGLQGTLFNFGVQNNSKPTILIMGDSHSMMLWKSFDQFATSKNITGQLITTHHPLLRGARNSEVKNSQYDRDFKKYILENDFKVVLISMRWAWYEHGYTKFETGKNTTKIGQYHALLDNGNVEKDAFKALMFSLQKTVDFLLSQNIKVFIMKQVPEMLANMPENGLLILRRGNTDDLKYKLNVPYVFYVSRTQKINEHFDQIANTEKIEILDPVPFFCDGVLCYGVANGISLYTDDDHLSKAGVDFIEELFEPLWR